MSLDEVELGNVVLASRNDLVSLAPGIVVLREEALEWWLLDIPRLLTPPVGD